MDIAESSYHGIPVLSVTGDLDHTAAPLFQESVDRSLDAFPHALILDLSGCAFLDSGALNVLLVTVRRQQGSGWVAVVGADHNLRRVFDMVGLTSRPEFRVVSDLSALPASTVPDGR